MNIRNATTPKRIRSIAIVAGLLVSASAAAEPKTINEAVYSKDQAEVGEELYKDNCLTCHDKKYFRPVLKRWQGQPLGLFYTVMAASMPESNPGSLTDDQYLDILAYILSLSRYPAGDAALHNADDALNEIMIANRK